MSPHYAERFGGFAMGFMMGAATLAALLDLFLWDKQFIGRF